MSGVVALNCPVFLLYRGGTEMKRAEWLQETRKMRFEEAYGGWQSGRLTQEEAARLLGICERTFRRYIDQYEGEDFALIIHDQV